MTDHDELRPFSKHVMSDLERLESEVDDIIVRLQRTKEVLQQCRHSFRNGPTKPCPLCGHSMKNLALYVQSNDLFGALSGSRSTMAWAAYKGVIVPRSWECPHCCAFEVAPPPDDIQIWSREAPPPQHSLAEILFKQFFFLSQIACKRTPHDILWYLDAGNSWYAIPGNKESVLERLGIAGKFPSPTRY